MLLLWFVSTAPPTPTCRETWLYPQQPEHISICGSTAGQQAVNTHSTKLYQHISHTPIFQHHGTRFRHDLQRGASLHAPRAHTVFAGIVTFITGTAVEVQSASTCGS